MSSLVVADVLAYRMRRASTIATCYTSAISFGSELAIYVATYKVILCVLNFISPLQADKCILLLGKTDIS